MGAGDKTIRLWDWEKGQIRRIWHTAEVVDCLAGLSPDGQTLAVGHGSGVVTFWDVAREQPGPPLRGHTGDVLAVAFSTDGFTLASGGRDHTVRLWNPVNGQEVLTLTGHEAEVHAVAFSPDNTILATGSHDGEIKLWRAPTSPREEGS